MAVEGTRADRGYVVVTRMSGGPLRMQICESLSPDDQPVNIYAEHVGVPTFEAVVQEGLGSNGTTLLSRRPAEVSIDATTGVVSIMDVARSPL